MTLSVKHATISGVQDSGDGKLSSNAWNEAHTLTGSPNILIGTDANGIGTEVDPATLNANAVIPVADRTALAALGTSKPAFLTESGREGVFVWSSANNATNVTADTQQGIYVAPASDTTGASGAWIRKFEGKVNPRWFGISDTNSGATNSSAMTALKNTLDALSTQSGTYQSLHTVSFPDDKIYDFASPIDLDKGTMHLTADIPASPTTGATLRFPAGVTGIRPQRSDTSGATANTGTGTGGDSSIIERLRIIGGYAGTEGEYHGVHIRAHGIKVRDCYISGFQGDGVFIDGDNGGNANTFSIYGNIIINCRDGIRADGSDANAGSGRDNDVSSNRRWGLNDSSFLGNTWHGIAENCGRMAGSYTPSMVSYSGNRYAVVVGQEVGASTNAPSGTTADNSWWYYVEPGAPDTTTYNIPAWVSGTTYRAGGPIRTDNNNAGTVIVGFYTEIGQGPSQLVWPTLVLGGDHLAGVKGTARLRHDDTGLLSDGAFSVSGNFDVTGAVRAGPASGAAADAQIYLDHTNFHSYLTGRHWSGGSSTTIGFIDFNGIINTIDLNPQVGGGYIRFQNAGTDIATVTSSGIDIQSGKALKYNGANVLTAGVLTASAFPALTGDVTTSAGALATTIAANAVTYAKFQQVAASSLVGNPTGSLANAQGITLAADHAFSGTTLQLGAFTGDITKSAGSLATSIGANKVLDTMIRQSSGLSIIGRSANTTGNVADIAGTDGQVLRVSGTTLGFGTIATAGIATNAVTYAVMQDVSATQRVIGRNTAGAGDPEEVTASQVLDWIGATQGQILYRGAAGWSVLATGTSGQFLKTQGAAANPVWADAVIGVTTANGVSASLSSGNLTFTLGAITPSSVACTGAVTSSSATAGIGYASGARGTVTQNTSKATGVTSNTVVTDITLNGAALAASTTVAFVFTNSAIAANDTLILNHVTTGTFGSYTLNAHGFGAGSCTIDVRNVSLGSLSEAIVIRAVLVKGG
jgi:hypothetical protein